MPPDRRAERPSADKHEPSIVVRKGRKHHDEGHGGAWKVAFADFCLALMCLFLVLWVMAARQQQNVEEVMRAPGGGMIDEGQGHMTETIGGPQGSVIDRKPVPNLMHQSSPGQIVAATDRGSSAAAGTGQGSRPANGTGTVADGKFAVGTDQGANAPVAEAGMVKKAYESPADLKALSEMIAKLSVDQGLSSNLLTVITPYGLRVLVHDTENQGMFERGSSTPNEHFRRLLRRMGPLFARMSNQMLVVGHTDSMQYSDRGYAGFSNWTLSSDRAMVARSNLLAGGMPKGSVLQVVGMADRAPMDTNDATAGINRRIELLILTAGQSRAVTAMFGLPDSRQPLTDDADSTVPDRPALQALRTQLINP